MAAPAEFGLSVDEPEPDEAALARLAALSLAGPRRTDTPSEEQLTTWAEQIQAWLTAERLQMTRIHELLAERGCAVSYNSLRRFIQRSGWHRRPVTMRLAESAPGEVAELDFGRLGLIPDPETGRRRTVWALIVVLRYSRHCFV